MNLTSNFSGTPPECYHEYLDLFTELRKPDDQSLIQTPFGGRYCGKIPPRQEPINKRTVTETSFVMLCKHYPAMFSHLLFLSTPE